LGKIPSLKKKEMQLTEIEKDSDPKSLILLITQTVAKFHCDGFIASAIVVGVRLMYGLHLPVFIFDGV